MLTQSEASKLVTEFNRLITHEARTKAGALMPQPVELVKAYEKLVWIARQPKTETEATQCVSA